MALIAPSRRIDLPPESANGEGPVLIGFADALAAPESAWSLLESGTPVVAFARRGSRPVLRRCKAIAIVEIAAPERDLEEALSDLRALLQSGNFAALMPLDDTAVWLCDAAFDDRGVPVVGPTGRTAALALDKRMQLQAAARAGLNVPATRCVDSVQALMELSDFPLALKPAKPVAAAGGRLARGHNYVCGNVEELKAAARAWGSAGPLLVQPLIPGVGEGLFGLVGSSGLRAVSAHRRVRMMNPAGSGSSACVSTPVDVELARACERMLLDIGWSGMVMLEFLRAADGTPWFMELNGRPWGSMALARHQGLEYPAWALAQLRNPDFEPPDRRQAEGQLCRHLGRELVHLLMVLRGPESAALTEWPSRWQTVREVLRFRRDDCWYNSRPGDRRLFLEDAVGTVFDRISAPVRA